MSGLIAGDPEKQWEWHEAYRDLSKNMYRTSYMDMSHGREVHVKSDYPSGYGGHIPSIRHDVLFRNTAFDRINILRRTDPSRDAHPSFVDHIAGIPTATQFPAGAKKPPSYGVVPHDGTTTMLKPPWGILHSKAPQLNHRNPPPTMGRMGSSSSIGRRNEAALSVGAFMARANDAGARSEPSTMEPAQEEYASPEIERLRRQVTRANQASLKGRMPTESEVLAEQMGMEM